MQKTAASPKILLCVLNWGLGHATRCIPLIRELQKQGAAVTLASDGRAAELLRKEFPALSVYELPAYRISYRTANMFVNIAPQLPKIAGAVRRERKAVARILQKEKFDCIISDNRYGCYSSAVPSIFMTHQLRIKMPFAWLENAVLLFNQYFIKKFTECWVPDSAGKPNLSAALGHGDFSFPVLYLGVLSRMRPLQRPKKYDYLVVLSGPEPQRRYLEEIMLKQTIASEKKTLIVQGKTEEKKHYLPQKNVEVISFMTSADLNEAAAAADLLICRSGYSTIMDLAAMRKKAVLIPTPGQTEQEYLAKNLHSQGIFYTASQSDFNLEYASRQSKNYTGFTENYADGEELRRAVGNLLSRLSGGTKDVP